LSVHRLFIVST